MKRLRGQVLITVFLLAVSSSAGFAQSDLQPEAIEVLEAAHDYAHRLQSLRIRADFSEESVFGDTHKLQFGGTLELGISPPSRLYASVKGDYRNRRMYLKDGTFTVFDEDVNVYATAKIPGPLNEALQTLQSEYGMSAPGGELFGGNAYELLVERASKVMLVGMANIGGVDCHHIAGTLDDLDWQLWIRAEGEPQFCKYVLTDRSIPLAPQFSITFTGWEANVKLPDSQFDLKAPADAERIEFVR
jgi:hypothetical protein